jgi:hypothetical protein
MTVSSNPLCEGIGRLGGPLSGMGLAGPRTWGSQLARGLPTAVLDIDQRDLHLFGGGPVIAVRFGSADYVSP